MKQGLQVFSTAKKEGVLELSLQQVDVAEPAAGEVLVEMQAAPINPSDMWPMFGPADISQATLSEDGKTLSAPIAEHILPMIRSRLDMTLPVGNEGAGVVIAAGEGAESLMGKTVAVMGGSSYAQYCVVPMHSCMPHQDGTSPAEAAASFVNPLTALCFLETMKLEGHKAIIHTAAASNLGQMLNRLCLDDGVELVNIVRKEEQVELLKSQGAKIVVNSSADTFKQDLYAAIAQTEATLAFDAIGGGQMASDILATMEFYFSRDAVGLNTYGSEQNKQVYLYGALDVGQTVLQRSYGMCWGIGGWLMPHCLKRIGMEKTVELQKRVANEIKTTFASAYTKEISLSEVLQPQEVMGYVAKKTGEKILVNPSL